MTVLQCSNSSQELRSGKAYFTTKNVPVIFF